MVFRFNNVSILHISYVDAPVKISSEEIEQKLDTTLTKLNISHGTLAKLTGVRFRRFWELGYQPSMQATHVIEKALLDSGVNRDKIDVLINCSVCKDYIEPSVASLIHGNVGLRSDCINYDVSNACLGFFNAIQVIGNMIEMGQIEYGMIVASEGSRYVIEKTIKRLNETEPDSDTFWKNFPTFTLGSGSFAMIITTTDKNNSRQIRGSVNLSNSNYNKLCIGQKDFMHTDGRGIQKFGIKLIQRTYSIAEEMFKFEDFHPSHIIPHQVSKRSILEGINQLNLNPDAVHTIFQEHGNIGPALVPITLGKIWNKNKIEKDERVLLIGAGSGLNASVMVIDW